MCVVVDVEDEQAMPGQRAVPMAVAAVFKEIVFVAVVGIGEDISVAAISQPFHVLDVERLVVELCRRNPSHESFFIGSVSCGYRADA